MGYGDGCLLTSRLGGLRASWGSVVSSPSGVQGTAAAGNAFWRILKAKERSFLYLLVSLVLGILKRDKI